MSGDGRTAEKSLGDVVNEVSTKASLLVREEIELAKTEVAEKAKSLGKGSAVAMGAGVMATFALIYFFMALAWFLNDLFGTVNTSPWLGFIIVFVLLIGLAGLAAAVGVHWIKQGSPPTPAQAIEEAKRTRAEILEHT
ncbi:MAG TPA: phage holin family protein [Thermoleophilaceae bacterium]|jgi:cobalamin biosynthesis protein CobD/CbiB|nr:phage holin family protein [Thermoleophilaceae bacterium]